MKTADLQRSKRLNKYQMLCLKALADYLNEYDPEYYLPFAPICEKTGFDRKTVRRSIRALARKGLTEYQKGLCSDDGEFAGAGYRPTKEGFALADACALVLERNK